MLANPALPIFLESDIVLANKDAGIKPDDLNMKNVAPYKNYKIGACGRENAWSGCDGAFELWDKVANVPVAKIKYYYLTVHRTTSSGSIVRLKAGLLLRQEPTLVTTRLWVPLLLLCRPIR